MTPNQFTMKYFGKGVCDVLAILVCTRFGLKYHKGINLEGLEPFLDETFEKKPKDKKYLQLFYT